MKAHTPEKHEKEIILSIGMIVKNEEKVLERCLKSLQPLMQAIPSELIIADTGSTDSTVEIAKKYTDNVFHFEWINDFAAARNSTLEKARGQWYLYIDADEYFDENVSEIIEFFNESEKNINYRSCQIMHRNYADKEMMNYFDFLAARFHRIKNVPENIKFQGSIHENIPVYGPTAQFGTLMYHTGYINYSGKLKQKKCNRNLSLLRIEYEKEPTNLRTLAHIIDAAIFEKEERLKYVEEALLVARANRTVPYSNIIYIEAIEVLYNIDLYRALNLCDEYLDTTSCLGKEVAEISIRYFKMSILIDLKRNEEAVEEYKVFLLLHQKYENHQLSIADMAYHNIPGVVKPEYIKVNLLAACCYWKLKRYDDVFDILDKIDVDTINGKFFRDYFNILKGVGQEKKDYHKLVESYRHVVQNGKEERVDAALYIMETAYREIKNEDERLEFAKIVAESQIDDTFGDLMVLVSKGEIYDNDIKAFINDSIFKKDHYYEVFYYALKRNIDIGGLVDKLDSNWFELGLVNLTKAHDDFVDIIAEYEVSDFDLSTIKKLKWFTLLKKIACDRSYELSDDKKYVLYLQFTELLGEYVLNIYNKEIFVDKNDMDILPEMHKFGYHMYCANKKLNEGNAIEYVREMRKALESCESMREVVEFMLEKFKKMIGM